MDLERIRRPQPVNVRTVWPSEPEHFTPWLAANLDLLSEALKVGNLTLSGTEHPIKGSGRYLDILAETADGEAVAIENQYGFGDHDHLTRALAYAVAVGAQTAVVVAEHHRPEFRAVADYLNRCADRLGRSDAIGLFLVEVTVDQVAEYFVPRFTVVSQPNEWIQELASATYLSSISEFIDKTEAEAQGPFRAILCYWQGPHGPQGGRVSHKAQAAVGLYAHNPLKGVTGETAIFVLYTYGTFTVNRGYLVDSGITADADLAELDAQLDLHFPGLPLTPKRYFLTTKPPTVEQVSGFMEWWSEFSARKSLLAGEQA